MAHIQLAEEFYMANEALKSFTPTSASIPPPGVNYRLRLPSGTPVHLHALNPLAFVLRSAQIYSTKLAIVHPDVRHPVIYSYAVWAQRIQNFAYGLLEAGIQPGDRIAFIAPNIPSIAEAYHGVLGARAIICAINTRLTHGEVAYILEHSGAKLIFVDHESAHLVKGAKAPVIVVNDTGKEDDPYEQFLTSGRKFSNERGWAGLEWERNEDAGCALNYTSGTTGRPKGVLTTLIGSYLAAVANAYDTGMNRDSTYLWILPMFHASGWTFPWAVTFASAAQICLRSVSYPHIWNHLINSGVTHYCGAPTVQIGLINAPMARRLEKPVFAIIAGSAPTAHLIGELEKRNIKPVHTYGPSTVCYYQPDWTSRALDERARLLARQGHAFATAEEVRVVFPLKEGESLDAPLVDVPKDGQTMGEIVFRGNIVMKEYFKDPEATRKAFRGGYFNSGDLAVWHPDGYIAIMDRSKDIIISGGENASSLAIEQELSTHPDVLEVSVVARSHPKWGERPMAFVILHPQKAEKWAGRHSEFEKDLKEHARKRLPGFACPEWVSIVPELPKTSTGKIQKVELRKIVAKL
ncbi:AMP-dependent synthetase and ligase [Dichomitus squalens LYAD-421 SS1]|uniref:AMP-dependent synthetase and ligase n=1 Tax=Dichomitus squalens (strain LYAD-421) TaxID=732165 RepID=UPI0004410DE7|nr:AMP-dependent synthetase and ligase [Dichomitus squalens LYAD-421 SS1]EJF66260.1 AMP-dependent synthetase and ligase [Dichomitus squalens LYAD-421 SS1]